MSLFREKSERVKTPALFPCAAKVKVPQLGSEETDFELKLASKPAPTSVIFKSFQAPEPVQRSYLKRISADLRFSEDVVEDRCFHMVPYDTKYLFQALDPYDIVSPPPHAKIPPGRHDARGMDQRHMPCHLTKSYKPHLKPLKRKIMERAREMHKSVIAQSQDTATEVSSEESFFLTEVSGQKPVSAPPHVQDVKKSVPKEKKKAEEIKPKKRSPRKSASDKSTLDTEQEAKEAWEKFCRENYDWDAYTLSKVSSHMSKWVVLEKMPDGPDRDRLKKLVEAWYGKQDSSDLLLESLGELKKEEPAEVKKDAEKPKKKWKKPESTILARVYEMDIAEDITEPHAHDPYSDDSKAPFYRKPVGLRRAIKHAEKEEEVTNSAGAINATADITIDYTYEPPAPPTIRDFINPSVGDKFYDTDNQFQQEKLIGVDQVHVEDTDKIVLSSGHKYQKKLQSEHPQNPETWYNEQDATPPHEVKESPRIKKVEKGLRRWKKLPEPADESAEFNMIPPGFDPEYHRSPDPTTRRLTKQNASLLQVIDEWRQKWHLSGQLVDSKPDDLIKDMADIQSHVRLKAIATIAKVAEYRPPAQEISIYGDTPSLKAPFQELPHKLFVALECLLDDKVDRVKLAAAITLYSLNKPGEKARQVLQLALQSETSVDRWAAAQCLAHDGLCNSLVVGEIVRQLLETEDTIKHEKAIYLLGKLSIFSPLVHCMVAEQLNSSSWRHKVIACKILPTLHGTINKDVTNKLMDLMWNDWHEDVRKSAAQCLGKTSHGREVHDDLRERIVKGNEATRLEAISKIGQLGIMTAKLLPVFLKCFEDEYISVRSEVCITCGNLEIKDEQVIEKLIHLATFDPIWKVKALAIQAMGNIGVVNEEITETLLWAVRYEEKPGVRAEACHTLMMLKLKTEEVAEVLQERFLVESSSIVREEIANTLEMFGISATEDMDMVAQIKNEVRKLCTKGNIAAQISLNEADDLKHENLSRMIYENEKEMERRNPYSFLLLRSAESSKSHCHFTYSVSSLSYTRLSRTRRSKESEEKLPPMMERIRSMSQASDRPDTSQRKMIGDRPHTPHRKSVSPTPSREVFTPTADEELHQIMSREDTRSEVASPEARPTSGQQRDSGTPKDQGTPKGSERSKVTTEDSDVTDSSEREYSSATGGRTPETERPTSVVKFASELQVEEIPGRSTLTPSKSAMEDMRVSTRLSSMAGGRVSSDVRAFSRDAIKEREKINTEALKSYAGLDMRYYDMIQDLIQVDNTYELMTGQRPKQPEVEQVKKITMIQSPSKALIAQSDEAIPVDDEDNDVQSSVIITVTADEEQDSITN
ncbi:HEAT repeat-containing protein 4-like [Saccostrea cucullata]|uniref:HEAT repeat-containing protein 4-like n=1 Tax=Saccostrea cuccullata TaxID=36930 RepID=UPI002ED1EEA2